MNKFSFIICIAILASASFAENYTQSYVADDWLKVTRLVSIGEGSGCTSVTDACSATGALLPQLLAGNAGTSTAVLLTFENVGSVDRKEVQLTESTTYVPNGAQTVFDPLPAYNDGRAAAWAVGDMKKGDKFSVGYVYSAKADQADVDRIRKIAVKTSTENVVISAPQSVKVGEIVSVNARKESGSPVSGATITVTSPDGVSQYAKTDSGGTATFTASKEGFYTYSIGGYALVKLASTNAAIPVEVPAMAAAAVATDGGILSSISGLLPALAAIFVIAVVALIAHNFFTSKKEDEYYYPQPPAQPSAPQAQQPAPQPPEISASGASYQAGSTGTGAVYRQQYSFGPKGTDEKHYASQPSAQATVKTASASPVQATQVARQAQASQAAAQPQRPQPSAQAYSRPQAGTQPQSYPSSGTQAGRAKSGMPPVIVRPSEMNQGYANNMESATRDDDVEKELAALERQAREEGETTNSEQEIENAIAELEAIRQKLRERKDQMGTIASKMASRDEDEGSEGELEDKRQRRSEDDSESGENDDGSDTGQPEKKGSYSKKAPAARVLPPKGRKLKLATHGVRRK